MNKVRRAIGAATTAGLSLLGTMVVADTAEAAPLACGTVITKSTTLTDDMNCTTGPALIVQGNGVVLKLNGKTISGFLVTRTVTHTVSGVPLTYTVKWSGVPSPGPVPSDGAAGIRVSGARNKIVGPGTVRWFGAGILLAGATASSVSGVTTDENIGPAGTRFLGDGIVTLNSSGNTISNNTISNNGPYSGVTLLGDSDNNTVSGNIVKSNNHANLCGPVTGCSLGRPQGAITFQQNFGVRYEGEGANGSGASNNMVQKNTITDSGNHGILFGSYCPEPTCVVAGEGNVNNTADGNTVTGNGFGYRVNGVPVGPPNSSMFGGQDDGGNGILLFTVGPNPPAYETITGNTVKGNARHGIDVGRGNFNTIVGNKVSGNNAAPVADPCPADCGATFNAVDSNTSPPCANNSWNNNTFGGLVTYNPNLAGDADTNQECVARHPGNSGKIPPGQAMNLFRRASVDEADGEALADQ